MKTLTKTTAFKTLLHTATVTAMLASIIGTASMANGIDQKQWYVRLIASAPAESLQDRSNILGQLSDSIEGCDSHDLQEMSHFGTSYLTIVFENDAWNECLGDHTSDFRSTLPSKQTIWDFVVKSDDPKRSITLKAEMPILVDNSNKATEQERLISSLSKEMWLKEISNGRYYEAYIDGKAQSYEFTMDGKTLKSFQWIHDKTGSIAKLYRGQRKQIRKPKREEARRVRSVAKTSNNDILGEPPYAGKKPKE